jgi:hypothetical protein
VVEQNPLMEGRQMVMVFGHQKEVSGAPGAGA